MAATPLAAARRPGNHLDAPATDQTDIVRRHLRHLQLRGQTADTIYCRRRALARATAAMGVPLLTATEADLAAWREGLQVTDETVVQYVSHVREFYRWAIGEGLRADNPAAGLPVPRTGRRLPRPISEEALFAAVASAPPRIRPWLVLAGWAGLRAREIALLKRACVLDTARPPVLLVAADATKGRSERIVPLCEFVLAELLAAGLPASGYVFTRGDGQPGPNRPWTISHLCNQHLHESGISATLHQARHWFATMTYSACRDLRTVQELLGHQHPSTTAGYAAYNQASAAAAVAALPTGA